MKTYSICVEKKLLEDHPDILTEAWVLSASEDEEN